MADFGGHSAGIRVVDGARAAPAWRALPGRPENPEYRGKYLKELNFPIEKYYS